MSLAVHATASRLTGGTLVGSALNRAAISLAETRDGLVRTTRMAPS